MCNRKATDTALHMVTPRDETFVAVAHGNVDAMATASGYRRKSASAQHGKQPRERYSPRGSWLDWSGVLGLQTLTACDPDNLTAPATIQQTLRLDWKDQYVFALGVAQELSDRTTQ